VLEKTCRPIVDYKEKVRLGRQLIADDVAHFHDGRSSQQRYLLCSWYLGIAAWNCCLTIGETEIVLSKAD
jgi:hypothetical protein